ncbi:MAG: B12-binding domain-containing radical SAM protein [Dehalococcoidales bacterium]|nr:B12-binding domain-containing radical SAM protein [Dehalococcoidales bacterium]
MKILMVYPQYPDTFWSFKHALKFASKRASFPPLGLLTVASMLPADWEKKLVDTNVISLADEDIKWADYVFISAMAVQRDSVREIIARCRQLGARIVAGGPLFTTGHDEFEGVDHFVLGEAEVTLQPFLDDLVKGRAKPIYTSSGWPDISQTPPPMWSLIDIKHYSAMSLQYSRGCPYNCEFCDIVILNGHKPRTKSKPQTVNELEALYQRGWRGAIFIVDDNFIGNKRKLKTETLPAIIEWTKEKKYPFTFYTEVSINLADDEELMGLMIEAGFDRVFVGIETPNEESLAECNKQQNRGRDLTASVKKLQNHGFEVQGGFIIGFDNDPVSIFRSQINFIQKSGIVTAMVGLLNAPRGTRLYQRLKTENRILESMSGDNTDGSLNFIPKMNYETLITGYKQVLDTIYSPRHYYERIKEFLREYKPPKLKTMPHMELYHLEAFFKSIWVLGIKEKGRKYYWKLFISTLFKHPRAFPLSIALSVFGYHFRKVAERFSGSLAENTPVSGE